MYKQEQIINHRLKNELFLAKVSKYKIQPKFIVIHYTETATTDGVLARFAKKDMSTHLIIDVDGSITQMISFDKRAKHIIGKNEYKGIKNINNHSIGIYLVNLGKCSRIDDYIMIDKTRRKRCITPFQIMEKKSGIWPLYPKIQIDVLKKVIKILVDTYPSIKYLISGETLTLQGGPGPTFPMNEVITYFENV